ncbi:hypothetical protein CXG81DRAFT_9216 [Caulochytrium protostelioides]|uniref:Gamma-glutamyltranspeptidase n=1 Tax=Caulochytrium protostelioides TaxID=1555241 RepID=A0A4P9XDT9_9FUNG|nr:hypothetical protein CXG81DRAFT_9216 [Caulochytrium protostelioides]|eukprot:RKP03696.1 hypothetical protein CXG81DRAFT_9216 [Caulochytrium protostelioides]
MDPDDTTVVYADHGAVSSENPLCSEAGRDVLADGGSAVDAAIAAALCSGVVNMYSSGIGGGGFMLDASTFTVDFRETAPAASHPDMYRANPVHAQVGGLAVGVPGELRGFETAHRRWGRLPWARLFAPAIRLARDGFAVSPHLAARCTLLPQLILGDPAFRAVFAPNGTLPRPGSWIRRTQYADTLAALAADGADAFYTGRIADALVRRVQATGGILTHDDLAQYAATVRPALSGEFRGRHVAVPDLPTSGPVLLSVLRLLDTYTDGEDAIVDAHRMIEAFKFGFAERGYYGDPMDPVYTNITSLRDSFLSTAHRDWARARLTDGTTHANASYYGAGFEDRADHGTMHVAVVDADGMAVSMTCTINLLFGAQLMDPETGIILNDEQDDFSIPGVPNAFQLEPSPYNFVRPGKRPLSSSKRPPNAPSTGGTVEYVSGGSGGSHIVTAVAQVLTDLWSAMTAPRLHHQLVPNAVQAESRLTAALQAGLEARAHAVLRLPANLTFTGVESIYRHRNGSLEAVSDPRKGGIAAGYSLPPVTVLPRAP